MSGGIVKLDAWGALAKRQNPRLTDHEAAALGAKWKAARAGSGAGGRGSQSSQGKCSTHAQQHEEPRP